MDNTNANQPKSIFASIDTANKDFVDDIVLAKGFTALMRLGDFSSLPADVQPVHGSEPSEGKDEKGQPAERYHAIWKEGEQLFGAWFFAHKDEDDYLNTDEIVYPRSITTVTKKSHQIVEDIYYRDNLGLPIEWVTYHNAQ